MVFIVIDIILSLFYLRFIFFAGKWRTFVGVVNTPCLRMTTTLHCNIPTQLEEWITTRLASEISSLVSGDDFGDNLLVSTPSPLVQQVLVVQAQMGSIWRLVQPLRHPVRPLRHPVRQVKRQVKFNRTFGSYCCSDRGSGHAQCHSRSQANY